MFTFLLSWCICGILLTWFNFNSSYYISYKVWDELLIHSKLQWCSIEVCDWLSNSSHTLLDMLLFIHAGNEVKRCYYMGPLMAINWTTKAVRHYNSSYSFQNWVAVNEIYGHPIFEWDVVIVLNTLFHWMATRVSWVICETNLDDWGSVTRGYFLWDNFFMY